LHSRPLSPKKPKAHVRPLKPSLEYAMFPIAFSPRTRGPQQLLTSPLRTPTYSSNALELETPFFFSHSNPRPSPTSTITRKPFFPFSFLYHHLSFPFLRVLRRPPADGSPLLPVRKTVPLISLFAGDYNLCLSWTVLEFSVLATFGPSTQGRGTDPLSPFPVSDFPLSGARWP